MSKPKPSTICTIKTYDRAGKGCALIDTAKNALLRMGDDVQRWGGESLKRNYGILGLAIDGIADEMRELEIQLKSNDECFKLKSANSIVDKIAENVANKVSKHLVRSKTESEATERTKGYDLFAKETPTVFRAYLNNDRILEVKLAAGTLTRSKDFRDIIIALAERARVVDYGGNEIERIYEKEGATNE